METMKLGQLVEKLESGNREKGGSIDAGVISIGATHLSNDGGFKWEKKEFISEHFFSKMESGKIEQNDILIVKDGATTGKVSYVDETFPYSKAAINEHVFKLRVRQEKTNPKFIFYFLYSPKGQKQILSDYRGATIGGISKGFIEKVEIPLPDLEIQNKIVAILDKSNSLIKKREKAIKEHQELLRATFLDIFGDPILNSRNWDVVPLGDVVNNHNNKRVPIKKADRDKRDGIYPYYGATGIIDAINDFKFEGEYLLIAEDGKNLQNRRKNNAFLARGKFWVNNHAHVLSFNGTCSLNYLLFFINNINLEPYITGIDQVKLNKDNLDKISVPIPPIILQNRFDDIYGKCCVAIEKLTLSLALFLDLFNALSLLAFKGDLAFNTTVDLEVFLNKIDPQRESNENDIKAVIKNKALLRLLIERLNTHTFENMDQYEKGRYVVFRILKEKKGLIKQTYNRKKAQIELSV